MLLDFTKKKFLSFSTHQQHKKCAKLLRKIYDNLLTEKESLSDLKVYETLMQWLEMGLLPNHKLKTIADRYHLHLSQALIQLKEHNLLPPIKKIDQNIAKQPWPIAVYFDRIRSAHNVGSMLRTLEAFSLGEAYFSETTPTCLQKQVQNTSMGTYQWITWHQDISLNTLPRPIIVLETSPAAESLFEFIFPESFTLVLGNEEDGCSENSLQQADFLLEIPLRGHKNSLNVANAFAIAAAEICKQKIKLDSPAVTIDP